MICRHKQTDMTDLIVNFGGPRDLDEIAPFLIELLTDPDVIPSRMPRFLHNWLFTRIAKKRAIKIRPDYVEIGGKSPIYFDTEMLAQKLNALTFHRYLKATHSDSLKKIENSPSEIIRVFPLFPQFSYATTGSIARFFVEHLSPKTVRKLRWIQSYATHPAFLASYENRIRNALHIEENKVALLFSAHGLPRAFVESGDIYEKECMETFEAMKKRFPLAVCKLSFQSKFGRGEWLRPYTDEMCRGANEWRESREIIVVPISFTSDHIETLYEVEKLYLPLLRETGASAKRCPALNLETDWIDAIQKIRESSPLISTEKLVKNS